MSKKKMFQKNVSTRWKRRKKELNLTLLQNHQKSGFIYTYSEFEWLINTNIGTCCCCWPWLSIRFLLSFSIYIFFNSFLFFFFIFSFLSLVGISGVCSFIASVIPYLWFKRGVNKQTLTMLLGPFFFFFNSWNSSFALYQVFLLGFCLL